MSFKVSDKVVCVDAVPGAGTLGGEYEYPGGYLKHGDVYVVNGLFLDDGIEGAPEECLLIVGKPSIPRKGFTYEGQDVGYASRRFRLLSEIQAENRARYEEANQAFRRLTL